MEIKIQFDHITDWSLLSPQDLGLIDKAIAISKTAYAKYSDFHVGAALLLENGEIVVGSNQENIAFPSGLCAERTALFYSGSQYPNTKVLKLVIYGAGDLQASGAPVTPCGSCRQVIAETISRQAQGFELLLVGKNKDVLRFNNALDLLPLPFGLPS
jgi:cytidine deaminase